MKIALTGGSGGLGRNVARAALREGHEIVSIDQVLPTDRYEHKGLRLVQADLRDYSALVNAFGGCDALIHMGAIPNPLVFPDHVVHNNNVVGSYNALRAAAELGITRICQASSVNAIGLAFSRVPRLHYFPVDEAHANYCEDAYSLSKWISEQQADAIARRYHNITIASMRFHYVVPRRADAGKVFGQNSEVGVKQLWGYTGADAAARACLLSLTADFRGHEIFYIVAPDTCVEEKSAELAARHYPDVPVQGELRGRQSFFTSKKAEIMLGWHHEVQSESALQR